ncbi:MAG: ATP-binding protein, partial [Chloroflexota bacterium]
MTRPWAPRPRRRPPWWPEGEEWPPREWRGDVRRSGHWIGGPRRRGPRPFGCLFLLLILLVAGLLTSAVWALAAFAGLVSAPPVVLAGGLVVTLVVFVAAATTFASMRRMTAPIDDLAAAADRIEQGDYSVRVEERGSNSMQGLVRAFNDMSARLASLDTGRRTFLADVAHELRTPLTVIEGQLEAIEDGVYPADSAHLAPIRDQIRTLEQLIDDLRTVGLAESGSLPLDRLATDIGALIDDVVAAFAPQARTAEVTLTADHAAGLPAANIDPQRIRQVLGNLLSNSLRNTPAGGRITVSACATLDQPTLTVEVTDSGRGISADLLPHVFDRFVKGDGSPGSGLGLAICRDIIGAHGGDIAMASEPSRGTTVTFTLPAVNS